MRYIYTYISDNRQTRTSLVSSDRYCIYIYIQQPSPPTWLVSRDRCMASTNAQAARNPQAPPKPTVALSMPRMSFSVCSARYVLTPAISPPVHIPCARVGVEILAVKICIYVHMYIHIYVRMPIYFAVICILCLCQDVDPH